MVEVKLAGFNIAKPIIDNLLAGNKVNPNLITPDVPATAFAWASHYNKSLDELLIKAIQDVGYAGERAKFILFELGHQSIAEHGIFNLAVMGLSRYATEFLEKHRLGMGITEKSQRYQNMSKNEFVIPKEFDKYPGLKKKFIDMVNHQAQEYREMFPLVKESLFKKYKGELNKDIKNSLDKKAKEDTRFVLPLASGAQIGISPNGRTLEYMIRKFRYSDIEEIRELGDKLYQETINVSPALIILTDPEKFYQEYGIYPEEDFLKNGKKDIKETITKWSHWLRYQDKNILDEKLIQVQEDVKLIDYDKNGEEKIISSLFFENGLDKVICDKNAKYILKTEATKNFFKDCFKNLGKHDHLPRAFEKPYFSFLIKMSASCFAQLKRHRPLTLITQQYNPEFECIIPENLEEAGLTKRVYNLMDKTNEVFYEIDKTLPEIAPYVLTNAHQREVIVDLNLREFYNMSRLREDSHAQWEIRKKVKKMSEQIKEVMPYAGMFLGGKHEFDEIKKEIYK